MTTLQTMRAMALSLVALCVCSGSALAVNLTIVNNNPAAAPANGPLHLVSSQPADWQKLQTQPDSIVLNFSGPINGEKSFIHVYNLNGDQLETGDLQVQGTTLSVTLPPDLTQGKYTVKWRAYCQCTASIELDNSFRFTLQ